MTTSTPVPGSARALLVLAAACALTLSVSTQTRITAPNNRYSLDDDVKLGREAAGEVTKELPLLNDQAVEGWVEEVGRTLTAAIPSEFRHAPFRYTFDVVNQKEINAFALPGGPMFLNRGMIESGKAEGEVAGVMAHEISHVALRHGTAQATAGQKFQIGSALGQILGAVVGGTAGSIIAQGTSFTLGTAFLKYSREYETQADILGAQILARAGYDPREMANMFKTIEAEGGNRGPQWLSSHPNPGNRFEAINREAQTLTVQGNAASGRFPSIQARLSGMSPAYTAEQIAKGQAKSGTQTVSTSTADRRPVAPPASQVRASRPFSFLRLNLPSNWTEVSGGDTGVTYAPEGGYRTASGELEGFTHGIQVGVAPKGTGNLQRDTEQLIAAFAKSNPQLRRQGGYSRETVGGRGGLRTTLSNQSDITGQPETISLSTALLSDGRLLYLIGVSPQRESGTYESAFRRVRQSVQLSDR
jgi:Zn-dependent protease with chaperone function